MKIKQSILNPIYISSNRQFSSLSKRAVKKWEKLGLNKDELTQADRNLWNCKGEIQTSNYTISFLNGTKEKQITVQAKFYSEAYKKVKKQYPNAVFIGKKI